MRLLTANNTVLVGGDKVIQLGLYFREFEDGFEKPKPIFYEAEFFGAEIEVDAILSYPWLMKNQVGVFPHHEALAKDWPHFSLLFGWKQANVHRKPKYKPRRGRGRKIWPILAISKGGGLYPPLKFGHVNEFEVKKR